MNPRPPILRPLLTLGLGALALAGGIALALAWLPEWHSGLLSKDAYVQRYRDLAARAGVRLTPGKPRVFLAGKDSDNDSDEDSSRTSKRLDRAGVDLQTRLGAGLRITVFHPALLAGERSSRRLQIDLAPGGEPLALSWLSAKGPVPRQQIDAMVRLLLAPGERLGERRSLKGETEVAYDVPGSDPPQRIDVKIGNGGAASLRRQVLGRHPDEDRWTDSAPFVLPVMSSVLCVLVTTWLFFRLLYRRRIDFANGLFLATISFVATLAGAAAAASWQEGAGNAAGAIFLALCLVAAWSAGESFLRSIQPGFTTSLDLLRARRLGPRGGRALLYGLGLGALLAGFRLASLSLVAALPGAWPIGLSLSVPVLKIANPFSDGVLTAAVTATIVALTLRFLPERRASSVALLLGFLAVVPFVTPFQPWPVQILIAVAQGAFLVWVLRRFGLTALLITAIASFLLPAAVFSLRHFAWLPVPAVVTAGSAAALLALGWIGLSRSEQIEREGRQLPAFLRRIEEEDRLRYEMDLLSRMQLGLLPEGPPTIEGWEIAVRSLLATEAGGDFFDFLDEEGRLWVAAGDVAGHGYSCAIAQAMTAAALTSLIHPGVTPAGVLHSVDRVLRRNRAHRNFTTLALLRLDLATGEGTLANAGHPFPLLAADGEVAEIALSGLPLGQGPDRRYTETPIRIPPGGVLLFCSDGLFEATDWQGNAYGYDRPRELLRTLGDRPANEILEALFADWRHYAGSDGPPADDTTVLVLKRLKPNAVHLRRS
ncbi:MAG TPA: SpoIIE family protein phosphatase [Thermoanaerobaculia bacterium]|nr:SpoIIE family protein phosphatase [Thermoanaerobaculia bacterium]